MGPIQMRVLTDTHRQIQLAARLDGAAAYLLPLKRGLKKLFDDGHEAHKSNPFVRTPQRTKLDDCEACSQIVTAMGQGPICIDNDSWKQLGDEHDFGRLKPSVDLLLFADGVGQEQIVMVEAKLGSATRRKGDVPQRPTHGEIVDKYDWSVKRIKGKITVDPMLWLIVSSNTLMKMRNRVRRWNKEDHAHPIVCTCCADFLARIGVQLSDGTRYSDCDTAIKRPVID